MGRRVFLLCLSLALSQGAQAQDNLSPLGDKTAAPTPADQGFSEEDDTIGFGEESLFMRRHCRAHPKDAACLELPIKRRSGSTESLNALCREDPLHERCRQYRDKHFERVLEVERFCKTTTNQKRCDTLRRQLEKERKF